MEATPNAPITENPAPQQEPPQPVRLRPYSRNGKIARLPKATRDSINTMLDDSVPYLDIIKRLGPDGDGLNEVNLSHWKTGGYLDWVRAQQLTQAIQAKYELAQDIIATSASTTDSSRALLHIIASNLCQFLADTDPATLNENLFSDADKFTRFVNAMVRLTEGGIKCDLHRLHISDRPAQKNNATTKPGISDHALQTAEDKLRLM